MLINYFKCKNIALQYFYINKLIIPTTQAKPERNQDRDRTQSNTGTTIYIQLNASDIIYMMSLNGNIALQ